MRLMEAIIDANHRAVGGDSKAGLHPADFEGELPLVALTCIDARLNALFPQVLAVPPDSFVWLRNAGNIITGPLSSTMRSVSLACAIKGGKEVAIIGHTDCLVGKTSTLQLLDALQAVGVERHLLPDNLNEYFGIFGSVRQNVIKAVDLVRKSPLLGPKIPVHGLVVDTDTGKLEWLVNGYTSTPTSTERWQEQVVKSAGQALDALKGLGDFKIGEVNVPEGKIGASATRIEQWLAAHTQKLEPVPPSPPSPPAPPPIPPKTPVHWSGIRPRIVGRQGPGKQPEAND
ncbi:MAG: carbonic anhydrase [Acidobacteriota bacterium]